MPCTVDTYSSPEDLQHRDAAAIRIKLLKLRGDYIPKDLYFIASGYYYTKDEVQKLCAMIRELGGTEYMETLRESLPKNPDVYEIYEWWLKHSEADAAHKENQNV